MLSPTARAHPETLATGTTADRRAPFEERQETRAAATQISNQRVRSAERAWASLVWAAQSTQATKAAAGPAAATPSLRHAPADGGPFSRLVRGSLVRSSVGVTEWFDSDIVDRAAIGAEGRRRTTAECERQSDRVRSSRCKHGEDRPRGAARQVYGPGAGQLVLP